MSSSTNRWKLGVFVTTTSVALVSALFWLGARSLQRESITAHYFFDEEVSGLEIGSPVQFRGVTIGKVTVIQTAADRRHVEVVSEVFLDALDRLGLEDRPEGPQDGEFVPPDLRVQLIRSMLTGVTYIQSDFFDVEQYPVPDYPFPVPWNTVHSAPSAQKTLEAGLLGSLNALPQILEETKNLLLQIEGVLGDMQLPEVSAQAISFLSEAEDLVARLDEIPLVLEATAALEEVRASIQSLRSLIDGAEREGSSIQEMIKGYAKLAESLDKAVVEADLPGSMASLRDAGTSVQGATSDAALLVQDLRTDLREFREAARAIRALAEMLEQDPGAVIHGRTAKPAIGGSR